MAEPGDIQGQQPPQPGGGGAPVVPDQTAAELEFLRRQNAQYEAYFNEVAPQQSRIDKLVKDPNYGEFIDKSYDVYGRLQEAQKPSLGPEWDSKNNPVVADIQETTKFVKSLREEREAEVKAKGEAWTAETVGYLDNLQHSNPDLYKRISHENNDVGMMIGNYARQKGVSFETALKKFQFSMTEREAPPSSLAPDAASPGVPGPSQEPEPKFKTAADRREWMAERIRKAQRRSA